MFDHYKTEKNGLILFAFLLGLGLLYSSRE